MYFAVTPTPQGNGYKVQSSGFLILDVLLIILRKNSVELQQGSYVANLPDPLTFGEVRATSWRPLQFNPDSGKYFTLTNEGERTVTLVKD